MRSRLIERIFRVISLELRRCPSVSIVLYLYNWNWRKQPLKLSLVVLWTTCAPNSQTCLAISEIRRKACPKALALSPWNGLRRTPSLMIFRGCVVRGGTPAFMFISPSHLNFLLKQIFKILYYVNCS